MIDEYYLCVGVLLAGGYTRFKVYRNTVSGTYTIVVRDIEDRGDLAFVEGELLEFSNNGKYSVIPQDEFTLSNSLDLVGDIDG